MVNLYENLQEMLEREVEKIVQRGELDQNSLCNLDKLIDVIKDTEEITAMRQYGGGEYSGRGNGGMYRMYNNGNYSYNGRDAYGMNGSENYSGGGYQYRYYDDYGSNGMNGMNGRSGNGDKNHMVSLMHQAMDMASSNEEREEIRQMIRKIENK